jgi:hypothetical protein
VSGSSKCGGGPGLRRSLIRTGLCAAFGAALALTVTTASAFALSGKPVKVGSPLQSGPPAVSVDSTGTAYVAWADTQASPNTVQYCVIPAGATGCSHSGTLTPADGATDIDGVQVVVDGGTVVILADVFGAQGASALDFEPDQEWVSTDGGATWSLVNGGRSVTSGIINADTEPLNALIVPGTGVLGYGWDTAAGAPTFNAFPLAAPPECSVATKACAFATLEPSSNPDQVGNAGGEYASEQGAASSVLAVFNTDFTNGPLGCSDAKTVPFGTAYAYASGTQSASNNYNLSPGQANSAWRVPISQLDCNVDSPAVAGGPSGFGVVENDDLTSSTIYHRFDSAHMDFDTHAVTIAREVSQEPAVSQDGAGGVYVTYRAGAGGPIRLAFSSDGGATWAEGTLVRDADHKADLVGSAVGSPGQGWATWVDNGSVFVQQFDAADAIADTIARHATIHKHGKHPYVKVRVACAITPCTIKVTVSRGLTLARGRFRLKTPGFHTLKVRLTGKGRTFLHHHSGKIEATIAVSQHVAGHSVVTTKVERLRVTG